MSTIVDESCLLENFLKARRQLNLIATHLLKKLELGTKQATLLRELGMMKTGSLAELSRRTTTDPGATTRAVELLLKKAWIRQTEDPQDRRRWNVSLTPKGTKMVREIEKIHRQLAKLAFQSLSRQEKSQFQSLLSKILNSITEE